VRISLSDDEYQVVATAAAGERLATGAFAAQAVLSVATGRFRPEYALLRETLASVMQAAGQVRRIGVALDQAAASLNAGEPSARLRRYAEAAAQAVRKLDDLADDICQRLP
jgi:hypothetical protein